MSYPEPNPFKVVFYTFAVVGWLWFFSMAYIKFSGAVIYATTSPTAAEKIDAVWPDAQELPEDNFWLLRIGKLRK